MYRLRGEMKYSMFRKRESGFLESRFCEVGKRYSRISKDYGVEK